MTGYFLCSPFKKSTVAGRVANGALVPTGTPRCANSVSTSVSVYPTTACVIPAARHAETASPVLSEKQMFDETHRPERLPLEQVAFFNHWPSYAEEVRREEVA